MDAIEKVGGPCVVLAGAGTGKTYTIVEKIKYLIEKNVYAPEKIVCITFSNEAANNLILRIDKILAEIGKDKKPIIRTFHGFSADLLRKYGDRIGIDNGFKILDPQQAMVILYRNLKIPVNNCGVYINTIGTVKDLGIGITEFQNHLKKQIEKYPGINLEKRLENLNFELQTLYLKDNGKKKKELVKEIKKIKGIVGLKKFISAWSAYEKLKLKGNYQDYSDLSLNALKLLEENPEITSEFDYIVVDEFQDTNKIQLDFLVKLAINKNITVVGDLNQSIYRFRGAYKENLEIFKRIFNVPDKNIFNLDKSYRSSNKILRVAHRLILNNYSNKDDCFFVENVHNREGDKVEVYELKNAKEEARKVVELIQKEMEKGVPPEEICVMFRAHQYGRVIRRALDEAGIAYYSVSKASLLKQKSVKGIYDYLKILQKLKKKERGGEQAWWDLMYHLDFSKDDLMKIGRLIKDFNKEKNGGILSVYLFNNLTKFELSESGKLSAKILIEKIKAMLCFLNRPISELMQEVYRISGLVGRQKSREEMEAMLNLNKFYELAKMHEELYDSELSNFLYYLDVLNNLGIDIEAARFEEKGVRLMTSHSTKGLEYEVVILTNMAQKRFPLERYSGNILIPTELLPEIKDEIKIFNEEEKEKFLKEYERHNQLLEERRLAYVSFTRAKKKLILTFASEYSGKKALSSCFLNEIGYKDNSDILFNIDKEDKYFEQSATKKNHVFSKLMNASNFESLLNEMVSNSDRGQKKEHLKFSPSALLLFEKCQKEFEYKYVYNMPERETISWEAIRLGSFVHLVLDKGVSSNYKSVEEFLELAKEISMDEEWAGVEFSEAETLIRVFFERNKVKYNSKSKTEEFLNLNLAGMDFIGFADRIDFTQDGVEIIDYKTGRSNVSPKARNWQLGFYALAAQARYGKVKGVSLEMLRRDRPLEFEVDDKGNAVCVNSDRMGGFNIYEVEQELIMTAHKIQEAYKKGFNPCPIEKNCEFCNEYVYGL